MLSRMHTRPPAWADPSQPVIVDDQPVTGGPAFLGWPGAFLAGIGVGVSILALSSLSPKWLPVFLLGTLFLFLSMILGNARKLLLAGLILNIPLGWDIHFGDRIEVEELGAIGGLGMSITTVTLAALYALWLAKLLTATEPPPRRMLRVSLPPALYVGFALLSLIVARDVSLSLYEIALLVEMFLLYLYIASQVRTRQDVHFILTMLVLGLLAESLILIGVYATGQDISLGGISTRVDPSYTRGEFYRPGGTLGSPTTASAYFALMLAPTLSLIFVPVGRAVKWLCALAFLLGGLALLLTFSRGGWIAFSLSMVILCALAWWRGWLAGTTPILIALVVLLVSLPFQDVILLRLFGADHGSAYSRIPLMELAFRIIADHPLLGIGANNFASAITQYATYGFLGAWVYVVHNKYLLVWAETGVGALLAFLWFLLATIRHGWQTFRLPDRYLSPLALGLTAAILGHLIHMGVDVFKDRAQIELFWLIAGLIAAMARMHGDMDKPASTAPLPARRTPGFPRPPQLWR